MDLFGQATKVEEVLISKATQQNTPIGGSMELLPLCNMNCSMCYVRLSREEMERKGRLLTVEEWIGLAEEMKKQGVLFLLLTGGEPLLYKEFKKLYLTLLQMGFIITINSNGTLIDEEWADFFGRHKPRRINITLYGKDEDTYERLCNYREGFARTIRGIKLLREHHVDVKMNGSLTKSNKEDLRDLIRIAEQLDVPINVDTYMYPAARERDRGFCKEERLDAKEAGIAKIQTARYMLNEEEFQEYCQRMLWKGDQEEPDQPDASVQCRAGRSSFVINWQGRMTPCIMLPNPGAWVFEQGFKASWKYLVEEVKKIRVNSECASCRKRNACPTCAACALLETGSYTNVPKYLCEYTDGMLEEVRKITR